MSLFNLVLFLTLVGAVVAMDIILSGANMGLSTLTAVVQIEAQALRDAAKTIARGEIIKVQIARAQRKLALLNEELNLIYPPLYDDRFGNNLATLASGIAGRKPESC